MYQIAIIQFPGLNCEHETRREIMRAGMEGVFFRWNDDPKKLSSFHGYVIPGGFSYEDRGRAGIIAALDPLMNHLAQQADKGKPVIGICNGAQILLESGLVPGGKNRDLLMCLAKNKRIKDGKVLGTGYYSAWIHVKNTAQSGRCAFTNRIGQGEVLSMPVAHGEGRFVTASPDLLSALEKNDQIVFRYSDFDGHLLQEFPINPNGALDNIAALCNPEGNVLAIMPHPERSDFSQSFLLSMKDYLDGKTLHTPKKTTLNVRFSPALELPTYAASKNAVLCVVRPVITDYEAETVESTAEHLGFPGVRVKRQTHFEIEAERMSMDRLQRSLASSGVLFNPSKEEAKFMKMAMHTEKHEKSGMVVSLLVHDMEDFVGQKKTATLSERLGMKEIKGVKKGTLWTISIPDNNKARAETTFKKLLKSNLFYNPHAQQAFLYASR